MSDEKFCPACEDYRQFTIENRDETYTVRGRAITVATAVEVCTTCEESLFDEYRDTELLQEAYGKYREEEGLLTPIQIKATRNRYRLSQKSLAALLGMSEATINRYENGSLQDRAHDSAIRACENATFVRDLLARNGHLLSDWQRSRAEKALATEPEDVGDIPAGVNLLEWNSMPNEMTHRTGFRLFDYSRYAAATVWFCRNLPTALAQTKLYKLLFYADFLNFRATSLSLTGAAYRKLPYGPVPADYGRLRDRLERDEYVTVDEVVYRSGRTGEEFGLGPNADKVPCKFTAQELAVLDQVAETFRGMTPSGISEVSHSEQAWKETAEKELISYRHAAALSLAPPE